MQEIDAGEEIRSADCSASRKIRSSRSAKCTESDRATFHLPPSFKNRIDSKRKGSKYVRSN